MSAPRIIPKGNDRTWTRAFYYSINRVMRRMWWEQKCDSKIEKAFLDASLTGVGFMKVGKP